MFLTPSAFADEPVSVDIDWQAHPAMHLTWRFFRAGLTERTPPVTWRHTFRQVVDAPRLDASGVRLFLAAAMAAEKARNPRQARAMILRELAYVEAFVAAHPDRYALAKSPAEARDLLRNTDKMVIVHSIEGGHLLLEDPVADAAFWAEQGVALITLIHLRDDELGGSAILDMAVGPLINARGARLRRQGARRGLTARGEQAIVALDQAGILVDLSHMSDDTIVDALAVTAANDIAPVVTHGALRSIRDVEGAWDDPQLVTLYQQGGVFALGLSGEKLDPVDATRPVPPDLCRSTLESWRFHYEAVLDVLAANGVPAEQRQVGWSSDWNGWLNHSRPVYGRGACRDLATLADPLPVDTLGLAHPGLLPDHWTRLTRDGLDLAPTRDSAERFLRLWEEARR